MMRVSVHRHPQSYHFLRKNEPDGGIAALDYEWFGVIVSLLPLRHANFSLRISSPNTAPSPREPSPVEFFHRKPSRNGTDSILKIKFRDDNQLFLGVNILFPTSHIGLDINLAPEYSFQHCGIKW
jgi:hypothetical protein